MLGIAGEAGYNGNLTGVLTGVLSKYRSHKSSRYVLNTVLSRGREGLMSVEVRQKPVIVKMS